MIARLRSASFYLLCLLLVALPFERIPSLVVGSSHHTTIRISQVIGLMLIVASLPLLWKKRGELIQAPWVWLVAFVLVCVGSIFGAIDTQRAILVTSYTAFVAALAWAISLTFDPKKIGTYERWLFAGTAIVVTFGLYQFFGDLMGLPHWATGLRDQYGKIVFGFPRVQSTALEPLYLGDYLLIPTALLLARLAISRIRWWQSLLLMASLVTLWLTVSRGALGALLVVLVCTVAAAMWLRRWLQAALAVVVVGSSLAAALGCIALGSLIHTHNLPPQTAVQNFSRQSTNVSQGESSVDRAFTRQMAIEAVQQHPWLGVGAGNFGAYAHATRKGLFTTTLAIVNNEPLEVAAETGPAGVLFLGLFTLALLMRWGRRFSLRTTKDETIWAIGLLSALLAIAVQYQTFSTLYITHIWVAIGLLMGLMRLQQVRKTNP